MFLLKYKIIALENEKPLGRLVHLDARAGRAVYPVHPDVLQRVRQRPGAQLADRHRPAGGRHDAAAAAALHRPAAAQGQRAAGAGHADAGRPAPDGGGGRRGGGRGGEAPRRVVGEGAVRAAQREHRGERRVSGGRRVGGEEGRRGGGEEGT